MIAKLVCKGGGVLISAEIGAITALDQNGILKNITNFGGTSAGSILAALLACGYSASEIKSMLDSTDFSTFEDSPNIFRFLTKYGYYSGNTFLNWIEAAIFKKTGIKQCTFAQLKQCNGFDLKVFASDLNTNNLQEFSAEITPNIIVSEAVRCSMSIPGIFPAFTPKGLTHLYVDGGCVDNYPIDCWDVTDGETIGMFLFDLKNAKAVNTLSYNHPVKWAKNVWETLMNAQDIQLFNNLSDLKRSIVIDTLGISATNFGISSDQKQALFNSGVKAATTYL